MTGGGYAPLRGLRVLDTADLRAELCGRLLADLGADVVRVEPPGGAPTRSMPPLRGETSLWFAVRNTNKRSVALDFSDPADRGVMDSLLAGADIWVETSRPGHPVHGDLEPAAVAARHPHLVVVSVTDFGHTGPYSGYLGSDPVLLALSWVLFRGGIPELPPVIPPGTLAYDMVGATAALMALTGHLDRLATGAGQHIDMSVMEAVAQLTDWGITSYSVVSKMGVYGEIRDGGGRVYPIIPCADGFVRPAMVTVGEWRKLRDWILEAGIGADILTLDHWDETLARLGAFDEVLRPYFVEFFSDKKMMDLAVEGQRRRIPITPMLTPADALEADQFEILGTFADTEVEGATGRAASGFLIADGQRLGARHAAPAPGSTRPDEVGWDAERSSVAPTSPTTPPGRPYAGLLVVEFGVAGAVPEMGRLLAEYGADVIRVENPAAPDLFRQLGGPSGLGAVFASSNRTTRSFAVDYATPEGRDIVLDLVGRADVVLENLTPGTLERCGLGVDVLRRANPGALIMSSQTMGRRGPWSGWRGYGSNTQLPSGMSWLWGFPDRDDPVPQNVAFPDHFVGRLGATTIAADLTARHGGGEAAADSGGVHVEIVQAEMAVNLLSEIYLSESLQPGSARRRGNRSELGAPWGVYRCDGQERWCVITCRDDEEWRGLVRAMGSPGWATVDDLAGVEGRRAAHDLIDERITEWTSVRDDRDVMAVLQEHGVPAGYLMYMSDQAVDPHLAARGYVLRMEQPPLGEVMFEGPAFHASRLPEPITRPAPRMGEHTLEIWTSVLGRDATSGRALVGSGLLTQFVHD